MEPEFVTRLTAQSRLSELPSYGLAMELSAKGQLLGDALQADPRLPGVVVTEDGAVRGVISRGQYLRLVSRYLGLEVYHPRPIRLMFEAVERMEDPLVLASETPIQDAVRRALERPGSLIYEPVIVGGAAAGRGLEQAVAADGLRLIDFPDLLRADSRISGLRNLQMKQILTTVGEGFLLVDRRHRIAAEYSASVEQIFELRQLAGRRLPAVLAELLSVERAGLARDYLDTLFNPNVIENLVADINPLQRVVARSRHGGAKHLAFRFRRSVQDGAIEQVLVRVEDVSREAELAAELEAQEAAARRKVDLVLDIVRSDAGRLRDFLGDLDQRLGECRRLGVGDGGARQAVARGLHALKGEAGLLRLDSFQQLLHRLEDDLAQAADAPQITGIGPLETLVADTRELLDQLRRLGAAAMPAAVAPPDPPTPSPSLFESIGGLVQDLSGSAGKPARFVARCAETEVPDAYRDLLRQVLVQAVRNAMAHGLEDADTRRLRGKPAVGTLQLAVRRHPQRRQLEVIFQDDGGGLDIDRLRRLAASRGMGPLDNGQLAALVFQPGLSTAAGATLEAGRGVGLDLVRTRVEEAGGRILVHSQPGAFCAFQILLPLAES